MNKSLTKAWEEAGKPRPPFQYLFDHPDEWREQWIVVKKVVLAPHGTYFYDDDGDFNGDMVSVRAIK